MQVPEPQFESQTKVRLNNPEVEGIVASVVNEQLTKYLEENPKDAQKIMKKVVAGRRGARGGRQGQEGAEGPQEHPQLAAACPAS